MGACKVNSKFFCNQYKYGQISFTPGGHRYTKLLDFRKSLVFNDLRGPGSPKPLIIRDLGD